MPITQTLVIIGLETLLYIQSGASKVLKLVPPRYETINLPLGYVVSLKVYFHHCTFHM